VYGKNDYVTDWGGGVNEGANIHIYGNAVVGWVACINPNLPEIEEFEKGQIEIGVIHECGILFIGFKVNSGKWCVVSYNYYKDKFNCSNGNDLFKEPEIDISKPLEFRLYIVNANTHQILAKRTFTLTLKMKEMIFNALIIQKDMFIPILHSFSDSDKLKFFNYVNDFFEEYDNNDIVKNMERKIYTQ
jgi:hypothetical protein